MGGGGGGLLYGNGNKMTEYKFMGMGKEYWELKGMETIKVISAPLTQSRGHMSMAHVHNGQSDTDV